MPRENCSFDDQWSRICRFQTAIITFEYQFDSLSSVYLKYAIVQKEAFSVAVANILSSKSIRTKFPSPNRQKKGSNFSLVSNHKTKFSFLKWLESLPVHYWILFNALLVCKGNSTIKLRICWNVQKKCPSLHCRNNWKFHLKTCCWIKAWHWARALSKILSLCLLFAVGCLPQKRKDKTNGTCWKLDFWQASILFKANCKSFIHLCPLVLPVVESE